MTSNLSAITCKANPSSNSGDSFEISKISNFFCPCDLLKGILLFSRFICASFKTSPYKRSTIRCRLLSQSRVLRRHLFFYPWEIRYLGFRDYIFNFVNSFLIFLEPVMPNFQILISNLLILTLSKSRGYLGQFY